jgi:GDP-4-dehydro-6-deoxy-D-mannose reductase
MLKTDLSEFADCEKLYWNHQFNKIFHLAAQSSVHISWELPFSTMRWNVNAINNLLEVFSGTSVKLIFAGSSEVYKTKEGQLTENDKLDARSPYAISRLATDYLIRMIAKEKKINCTLLRLFPHTGAGQSTNFALPSWAKQLAMIKYGKQERKIYCGNLNIRRDFCDVRDVVRAYDLVSNNDEFGECYNISSGQAYLMKDLLNMLIEIAGISVSTIEVIIDEKRVRKNDIMYISGSYQKIKEKFGWEPLIPIEETLKDLLLYWEQHIEDK